MLIDSPTWLAWTLHCYWVGHVDTRRDSARALVLGLLVGAVTGWWIRGAL